MHDGESAGITERCDESEPIAQGGDEMIHPVGFAGIRIMNLDKPEYKDRLRSVYSAAHLR